MALQAKFIIGDSDNEARLNEFLRTLKEEQVVSVQCVIHPGATPAERFVVLYRPLEKAA